MSDQELCKECGHCAVFCHDEREALTAEARALATLSKRLERETIDLSAQVRELREENARLLRDNNRLRKNIDESRLVALIHLAANASFIEDHDGKRHPVNASAFKLLEETQQSLSTAREEALADVVRAIDSDVKLGLSERQNERIMKSISNVRALKPTGG